MTGPLASIIVPTRNRPGALRACLEALAAQSVADRIEVLVVDDASVRRDAVVAVVAAAGARLVHATGSGPAAARNLGIAAARGDVVLMTDDDCRPSPRWAELLRDAVALHGGVVRGTTIPSRPLDPLLVANEVIVEVLARSTPFAATSNVACARSLLVEHPFDERFPLAAGEDREWCLRLDRLGVRFRHIPEAVVQHDAEMSLGPFWRRHVRYGRAARRLLALGPDGGRAQRDPRLYAALLRGGLRAGARVGAAIALAQVATVAGYAAELVDERRRDLRHSRARA